MRLVFLSGCRLGVLSILYDYENVVPIWGHHYLVLLENIISLKDFKIYYFSIFFTFVLILRNVRSLVGSSSLNIVFA